MEKCEQITLIMRVLFLWPYKLKFISAKPLQYQARDVN